MNCYLWELEALLEGLALREIDKQERQSVFAFTLRYVLNAKKPNFKKVFNKEKQEKKIKDIFNHSKKVNRKPTSSVISALNYFKNR